MATTTFKHKTMLRARLAAQLSSLSESPSVLPLQAQHSNPVTRRVQIKDFVIEQAAAAVRGAQARRDSVAMKLRKGCALVTADQLRELEKELCTARQRLAELAPVHPLADSPMN